MQDIIVEKPYRFITPHRGSWAPSLIQSLRIVDWYLNRFEGIVSHEVRGIEHLNQSLRDNLGILLAPNHCRYADPIAIGWVARQANVHVYAMASWHLFNKHWLQSLAIRLCGGFSVNREGIDRQSIDTAIELLTESKRPLVVFPEGAVFRTNDELQPLLDGISFLARSAAKRKERQGKPGVVIHPVAIKYLYRGEILSTVEPVIKDLEQRFTWAPGSERRCGTDSVKRVQDLNEALLCLKEIEYLGSCQTGSQGTRRRQLTEHLLSPLELVWLGKTQTDQPVVPRVKQLRMKIVPKLLEPLLTPERRQELWQDLSKIYLAQQIMAYPEHYLDQPTDTRLLETVERLEEDIYDKARTHRPLHAVLEVGEAIEVKTDKPPKEAPDPLMQALYQRLQAMLDKLACESQLL